MAVSRTIRIPAVRLRPAPAVLLLALAACGNKDAPAADALKASTEPSSAQSRDAAKQDAPHGKGKRKQVTVETDMADVIPADLAPGDGSKRMVARLAELAARCNPEKDGYENDKRVVLFTQRLDEALKTGKAVIGSRLSLATELLLSGAPDKGLEQLDLAQKELDEKHTVINPEFRQQFLQLESLCWLRVGEQGNCVMHHGKESCLAPITEGGRHMDPTGSREAMKALAEKLEGNPDDYAARWLYNIAAQTVGDWPDKVPEKWLVPPAAFASEQDVGHFPNVAQDCGIEERGHAGGVCEEDFDGDGLLDLIVSDWCLDGVLNYYHNDGDGGFTERGKDAGFEGINGGLNLLHADYDNDGDADVLVLRGAWRAEYGIRYPPSLLQNDGKGHFRDVTEESGALCFLTTQTACWGDYDNDGSLDLFFGNESVGPHKFPCRLYHNDGTGHFEEVGKQAGVDFIGYVKGSGWGDYDDDGFIDLFLSRMDGAKVLYHNNKDGTFTDVAQQAGAYAINKTFPTWWFDYDNDGHLDLFVSGYSMGETDDVCRDYLGLPNKGELPHLFHNSGDGHFEERTVPMGMNHVFNTMGCNWGDIDNDGWPDMYLSTGEPDLRGIYPNRLLRNDEGKRFVDVTTSADMGHIQKGHAIAFGDLDNDGDQDVFAVMGGAYRGDTFLRALFENPGHPGNHWVTLQLQGVKANRCAIGARIRVHVRRADGSERDIWQLVGTGGSFGSETLQAEIGLGDATAITEVEIRWPGSGTRQILKDLPMEHFWHVTEGDDKPVELVRKPYKLGRK
jgi:ASPIC and UnbV/FG-GAP-like repeat